MYLLFISVFLFGLCGSRADDSGSFGNEEYFKNYDLVHGAIIDPNKEEDKLHPCDRRDWQCMRKFLASNSDCRPSYGPVPDPLKLPVDKFYIPFVNITITHKDLEIRGFKNAEITELYVNKDTGNLVIAINVRKLNQKSPKTYFTYQRTGKEPIVRSDYTTVTYDSATFTAVIPKVPHLRLDKAEVHADIHDGTPVYAMGPGLTNSTDPDVVTAFLLFEANIPIIIQEAYTFQSSLLTTIYIQKYLCDFGIDSYGNYLSFIRSKGYTQNPSTKTYEQHKLYDGDV